MIDSWTNTAMDVMPLIGLIFAVIFAWRIAHSRKTNGGRRTMDACGLILLALAMYAGEQWFVRNESQPFFLGLGHVFEERNDLNPIIFMIVVGGILTFAGRFLFHRIASWWNGHESWGNIGDTGVSFMYLTLWMLVSFNIGAHYNHITGETPAQAVVATGTRTLSDAFKAASEGMADLSKTVEESQSN